MIDSLSSATFLCKHVLSHIVCLQRSHKQLANRLKSKTPYKKARQQLKEQRSGLFIKEQIVAVESSEVGELDDVDILT